MAAVTHQTFDTELSADSLEWCPVTGFQDLLLCGTYQLDDSRQEDTLKTSPQVRVGRLYLHHLDNQSGGRQLQLCNSLDMPGILDIKWSCQLMEGRPCFAIVNSVGQLRIFIVKENMNIVMVTEEQLDIDCLGLSLDWNNMLTPREVPRIVSSDSKGGIHIHQFCEGCLKELASWKAHDFEAWISSFDQWNTDIVYTGGDDCKLKTWDLRVSTECPVLTSKRHSMGVCSVQSNPVQEHQLATGSYDENLLVWDGRNMKQPIAELGLGGGIWRIKWEPVAAKSILTATMYNGFHIVDTSAQGLSVLLNYREHQSIAYGADWCRISSVNTKQTGSSTVDYTIGTCSFYDHLLKLWTYHDTK